MLVSRWCCFFVLMLCRALPTHAETAGSATATLDVYISEYPPFCYTENGVAKGMAVETVEEIMRTVGEAYPIQSTPWKRGLYYLANRPNAALFTVTRTEQRESLYKWVGPVAISNLVFFAAKDSNVQINNMDDARAVSRIGTVQGYSAEKLLQRQGFANLVSSPGSEQFNPGNLVRGYLDLWVTVDVVGVFTARLQGIDPGLMKIVYVIQEQPKYIAFSKEVPDSVIQTWQDALDEMKRDGRMQRITRKWLGER
ncbi:ABC transporter substrate-binding protein [Hahella sp. HN01]|uniref:substrate-binding periplasmic protein n=1 Tax=Hahella sp. HN01 TaxID=2847262 RepID=UPI001C1E928D|nr:transporter substrate-binding domain-containing protein [Hahella sp. HN01]MBU6953843.1 ABC transporter substrate-binding protein [Hahella sp. HN01]